MYLNTLQPASGAKRAPRRLGRGIGSGFGKTAGKGHKGQKARAGGYHKVGFEGGQTPYQRKMPKFGFTSQSSLFREELRLSNINKFVATTGVKELSFIDLKSHGLIKANTTQVKLVATGTIEHPVILNICDMFKVSKGAQQSVELAGGKVLTKNV